MTEVLMEGNKRMRKPIVLWGLLIVLLLISLPGIVQRWNAELENNTYEIIIPFEDIKTLTTNENQSLDDSIQLLKDAGLTTISFEPLTLYTLEEQGIISLYREIDLYNAIRFVDDGAFNPSKKGYYITVPEMDYDNDLLQEAFQLEEVTVAGEPFYFLQADTGIHPSTSIAYDKRALDLIEEQGLQSVFRVPNDTTDSAFDVNTRIVHTLVDQKSDKYANILFAGQDVIGYPNIELMNDLTKQLHDANYHFYTIEFAYQFGLPAVAKNINYDVLRLHSIDLDNKTLALNIEQAVRAIKERNIRSIFLNIQTRNPVDNLENAISFIEGVKNKVPNSFQLGAPEPFSPIHLSTLGVISILAAGVLFTYLAAGIFERKWIQLIGVIFMTSLALLYVLSDRLILLQSFGLIISVITPIFAILNTINAAATKISDITFQYVRAILISLIGITIVVGLLNGNAFITGFEVFRGVKLVYILPLLFISIFLFYKSGLTLLKKHGMNILQAEVKYWHLIVFGVIGMFLFYYISRTGNTGSVSEFELMIRSTLENILYVRPRTKEFLIGFPFFILAFYVMGEHKTLGKVLVLLGTIGFVSMMNTFTHFHIPLYLSLWRTAYSIVFGYIIGILFIFLYKLVAPPIRRVFKKGVS